MLVARVVRHKIHHNFETCQDMTIVDIMLKVDIEYAGISSYVLTQTMSHD